MILLQEMRNSKIWTRNFSCTGSFEYKLWNVGLKELRFSQQWWFKPWIPTLHPEDRASIVLQHIGILPHHHTVSQPKRPGLGRL